MLNELPTPLSSNASLPPSPHATLASPTHPPPPQVWSSIEGGPATVYLPKLQANLTVFSVRPLGLHSRDPSAISFFVALAYETLVWDRSLPWRPKMLVAPKRAHALITNHFKPTLQIGARRGQCHWVWVRAGVALQVSCQLSPRLMHKRMPTGTHPPLNSNRP